MGSGVVEGARVVGAGGSVVGREGIDGLSPPQHSRNKIKWTRLNGRKIISLLTRHVQDVDFPVFFFIVLQAGVQLRARHLCVERC